MPHLPSYHHVEMCVMLSKEEHVTSCPCSLKQRGLRAATVMLAALRWPEVEQRRSMVAWAPQHVLMCMFLHDLQGALLTQEVSRALSSSAGRDNG